MKIEPDSKYYPVAKKLADLIRRHNEQNKRPTTPEEILAEMKRIAEQHKAMESEMAARGYFKDFEARWKACKTDEERTALADEHSNAINAEVFRRQDPELSSLLGQFNKMLEEDGKLEEFMPEEVREALRMRKEGSK